MKTKIFKVICCILLYISCGVTGLYAQQANNITGAVYDSEKQPLVGVAVTIQGTQQGTFSDLDGKFTLPASGQQVTVNFSYLGFESVDIVTDGSKPLYVTLKESRNVLDETVVIGYGSTTKKEITGSIASLKKDDFNNGVFTDAMGLLQGKVAGLSVLKPGGANPQAKYEIILRGTGTLIGSASPLVIVDGITGADLNSVNFDEIESIDILKDGSAAAIYGTRGTNGVIIITTKRAKAGKTSIEYSGQLSLQVAPRKVDNLSASEFVDAINNYAPDKKVNLYGNNTDWFDEITRSTPFSHRHSLSLSGGTDQFSHRTVLNVEQNQGLLRNNEVNKYLFKTNIVQREFNNKLVFDLNATYSHRDYKPASTDLFYQAFINNPTAPVYGASPSGEDYGGYFTLSGINYYNPVAMMKERTQKGKSDDFVGSLKVTLNLFEFLNWSNQVSYTNSKWEDRSYKTKYYPGALGTNGEAEISNGTYTNKQYETLLNYAQNFNKHNLQVMGGYSYIEETSTSSSMFNNGFDTDYFGTNNIGAGGGLLNGTAGMSSYKEKNKLIAFFGRAMYNYDDRYLVSASIRREGSTKFGDDNKWGWFPAVSLGWRISGEDFMKELTWINDLKLRAGFGVTGNQGLAPYKSLILMEKGKYFYYNGEWIPSYEPATNPNPDLKWEKKYEYNVGIDFSLLNSRLYGTIDYYYRDVKDLLYEYAVPSPPYIKGTIYDNIGQISNAGIEITLTGVPVKTKDWGWTTSASFSSNKNKLKKLSNDYFTQPYVTQGWLSGEIGLYSQRMIEGKSIGVFYGPKWLGLDEFGKDLFANADPMGKVLEKDFEKIGDAYPTCNLGWSNTITYKDWSLNFSLRASLGGKALNQYRLYFENWGVIGSRNIIHTQYEHPEFTGNANYSSKYIESTDFLKLDNITIGYNVPIRFKYISSMRASLTAQDVFCITGYDGLDPEVSMSGLAPGIEPMTYYPRTTTITFGLNVTF